MRFSKAQRVTKRSEYQTARDTGNSYDCGAFVVQISIRTAPPQCPRLGVIATKRLGNAVVRNRAKRRFRELFRRNQAQLPDYSDLVIIPRAHFNQHDNATLDRRFLGACKRWKKQFSK